jgi:hypothetical protein
MLRLSFLISTKGRDAVLRAWCHSAAVAAARANFEVVISAVGVQILVSGWDISKYSLMGCLFET